MSDHCNLLGVPLMLAATTKSLTTVINLAKGAVADTSAKAVEVPTYHACILAVLLDANTA